MKHIFYDFMDPNPRAYLQYNTIDKQIIGAPERGINFWCYKSFCLLKIAKIDFVYFIIISSFLLFLIALFVGLLLFSFLESIAIYYQESAITKRLKGHLLLIEPSGADSILRGEEGQRYFHQMQNRALNNSAPQAKQTREGTEYLIITKERPHRTFFHHGQKNTILKFIRDIPRGEHLPH